MRGLMTAVLLAVGLTCAAWPGVMQAAPARLRVALVSGAPTYGSDHIFNGARRHLEALYPIDCSLILANISGEGFDRIDRLAEADVALFFVRRQSPPPETLSAVREFIKSGKGLVAVGPSSHAWETWPTFDVDVLGAKYTGPFAEGKGITEVRVRPHAILTGGEDFTTDKAVYGYTDLAKDVQVVMEGGHGTKLTPIAWTRERHGTRIFYLGPAHGESFSQVAYIRIIANSLFWAARREIPGVGTRIHRTWMPDAHPSSLAVGFPSGLNVCFDPTRGGMAYAWDGDYIDRWPTIAGKFPRDAGIPGTVFYRAPKEAGFRPEGVSPAKISFRGYRLQNGIPEFRYEVDGLVVSETISPRDNRGGVVSRFRVETPDRTFQYEPVDARHVTVIQGPAGWVEGRLALPPRSVVEFSVFYPR